MNRQTDAGEATVTFLCTLFAVSRQAFYAATKAPSPSNVVPLPRRPRFATVEAILEASRRIIAANPAWGVRKVWATMRREGLRVSRKRVWAVMRANGLVLARDREPGETTRGHVSVPEPNRRLATDLTTVWTKREGWVAIVPTIDCGCRSVLALTVTKDQHSPAVLASLDAALEVAFGQPEFAPASLDVRTDHGPQYTGADCAALIEKWGVGHTFAPVGRPTGNAVVERVIRTMKEELVWLRDWDSADELRDALGPWREHYNTARPHQALDWKTPSEYRALHLGTREEARAAA